MDQIRVLHIQRMSAISGSEKYIRDLSFAQRQGGYDVAVAISCNKSDYHKLDGFAKELREKGIDVFVLYSRKWFSRKMIGSFTRLCREWQPSLVHTHLLHADVYASVIKKFFIPSLKIISTKHGFQEVYLERYGFTVSPRLKKMPFYWLSRLTEKQIDFSYTISRAMSLFYRDARITKKAIPFIYHGLKRDAIQESSFFPDDVSPSLLVTVGRLTPYKGFRYLLEAMAILKKKRPDVMLDIVGNGPQRQELENLCKELELTENVRFLGFRPQPEQMLAKAALVVIPSLVEPFGLVFLEAMALGKVIIAFDVPAGNEIVRNGETGFLIDPGNPLAMANKIDDIMGNTALAKKMGANAQQTVCDKFNFDRVVAEVNQLYLHCLDSSISKAQS